jgi:hypothetical protein
VTALATAACGSGAASTGGGGEGSTTPSPALAPFRGTFTTTALPAGVQALQGVDCASDARCWAVGSTSGTAKAASTATIVTTTDGGSAWTVQPVPATVGYLSAIACPTTRSCTAVGQVGSDGAGPGAVVTTQNAGATWMLQSVPTGTTDVTAVACPTTRSCRAMADVAGRVTALTAGGPGSPWAIGGGLPATVASATGLSCTDAMHCWATLTSPVDVGHATGAVAVTADGGATWALQPVPTGTGVLRGIGCAPRTTTATSGSTTGPVAPAVDCVAVGTTATVPGATRSGQGLVLTTATGGATWSPAAVTATSAALQAVSCGAGPCVAVGTTVTSAPEAGLVVLTGSAGAGSAGWRRAAVAAVPLPLTGVSCRSLSSCVAVGESVSAHLTAG